MIFAQRMVSGTQSFSLLAIPFFILAGDLMTAGGISRRLVGFADVLVRHRTGGLGMVAVLAAAFFAALSGSAPATTAAIGAIMIPEMEKRGYSRAFATALAVAGGIIGPMLPPSIPMVVWGVMSETSISDLFLAGIVPGLLLALGLMALCWQHARKHNIAAQPKATRAEVWVAFNAAKWALCGPILVLGGIYGGIVTPTEAAIVAAIFALVLGFGLYRELTLSNIIPVTRGSLKTMTIVMFIIALANGFGWVMAFERIPGQVTQSLEGFADTPALFLLMLNLLLLVIGCVMDNLAAMIILASFLVPIGEQLGMDPVQFGAMIAINFTIGMATPPFGYTIFIGAAISGLRIGQIARPLMPMLGVMIGVLLLVAFVPQVTLGIVGLVR
jgi:tripartite ATP-independent transporter DctM subunit